MAGIVERLTTPLGGQGAVANNANRKLEVNVRKFVNGYLSARNKNNKTSMNNFTRNIGTNVRAYVNMKRAALTGATLGALSQAPLIVQEAGAVGAEAVSPNVSPGTAGQNVATGIRENGGTPVEIVSGGTAAANQQALEQGLSPAAAQNVATETAAELSAQHTNTPVEAASVANAASRNAGLNAANANKAAKKAALLSLVANFKQNSLNGLNANGLRNLNSKFNRTNLNLNQPNVNRVNAVKAAIKAKLNALSAPVPTRPAPPPPPPPPPKKATPLGTLAPPVESFRNRLRKELESKAAERIARLKVNPVNTGKRTANNKAVYAPNAASNNYYGKKNNSNTNYYRLKNNSGQLVINTNSPAYEFKNGKFLQKN
jgi:hypothetical protein